MHDASEPKVLVFSAAPVLNDVALATTGRVRGEVVSTEAALPMEDVVVILWDASWRRAGTLQVDAAGTFRFEGVRPGTYTVSVQVPPGFVAERAESRLELGQRGDVTVRFNVRGADTLSGRVVEGSAPAAGVFVDLVDAAGKFVAQRTTGPSGDYRFEGLQPGRYTVLLRK